MSLATQQYVRKPFYVDAVQVTEENLDEVARWCGGDVRTWGYPGNPERDEKYIKVKVARPLNERQTKAFLGDWVLEAGTSFKVYTPSAFENSFQKTHEQLELVAEEAPKKIEIASDSRAAEASA